MARTTYSTDRDLSVFYKNIARLQPTADLHEQAFKEINRRLRELGKSAAEIEALTDEQLADMVSPACFYVLYLASLSVGNHELAQEYRKSFVEAFKATGLVVEAERETGNTTRNPGRTEFGLG
jgi:hypothetical protein